MNLFLAIIGVAAALVFTGIAYQCLGARSDRRRYARDGRWIDIGNRRRLYLVEKGSGNPTVLFEAGIAATNLNWFHIQEPVSRLSRVHRTDVALVAGDAHLTQVAAQGMHHRTARGRPLVRSEREWRTVFMGHCTQMGASE